MLAEANFRLPYQESKLLLSIIAMMQQNPKNEVYAFRVAELTSIIGLSQKKVYQEIDEITNTLMSCIAGVFNREEQTFEKWILVDEVSYKSGTLVVRPSAKLRLCIFELTAEFTQLLVANVKPLRSMYAIRLYILIRQYASIGHRELTVAELKQKLEYPDSYADFGIARRQIIEPALSEIRTKTDMNPTAKYRKSGRAIVSVLFSWSHKNKVKNEQPEFLLDGAEKDPRIDKLPSQLYGNGVKLKLNQIRERTCLCTEEIAVVWLYLQPLVQDISPLNKRGRFIVNFLTDIRNWPIDAESVENSVSVLFEKLMLK